MQQGVKTKLKKIIGKEMSRLFTHYNKFILNPDYSQKDLEIELASLNIEWKNFCKKEIVKKDKDFLRYYPLFFETLKEVSKTK